MLSVVFAACLSSLPLQSVAQSRPWDMLKDPAYQDAHRAMLGSKRYFPWIAKLECTAGPRDVAWTKIGKEDWLMLRCCKPHWCTDSLVILYSEGRRAAYGIYDVGGTQNYLGRPPKHVKAALDRYFEPPENEKAARDAYEREGQ
jgi:hypothetical protein